MTDNQKQRTEELMHRVNEGVRAVYESDSFKSYLRTMSKFHNYSARNSLLILMVNPSATLVAGYQSWIKNFNRHVKKGEKGIPIFAYTPLVQIVKEDRIDKEGKKYQEQLRELFLYLR